MKQGPSKYFTLVQKLERKIQFELVRISSLFSNYEKKQFIKLNISNWRMLKIPKIPVQIDGRLQIIGDIKRTNIIGNNKNSNVTTSKPY